MAHYKRFHDCSISEKLLDTIFLLTIGLGYLFALGHTYFSHEGRDGQPGMSVQDVEIAYYGKHQQTRLGAALNGGMGGNLEYPEQKEIIFKWVEGGTDIDEFNANVAPIMNENCVGCHSEDSGMNLHPLTTYEEVMELTRADTGASIESLVRVSHIHLFGIAFILFFVGRIFILCEMAPIVKRVTVIVPFIAIVLDIFSWYLTKVAPGFAYVVVLSGGLMGLSLCGQILVSIYQMWFYKPNVEPIEM